MRIEWKKNTLEKNSENRICFISYEKVENNVSIRLRECETGNNKKAIELTYDYGSNRSVNE